MQIIGAESDIADWIMCDPSVIEEVLRTDREKWKRSGAIDLYGVARYRTPVIAEIKLRSKSSRILQAAADAIEL